MTNAEARKNELEALSSLLDVCGADRTRWPARERLRFAGLIVEDATARRLVAEARALDSLLDEAPRVEAERQQMLAARIVATAIAQSPAMVAQQGKSSSSVIAWPGKSGRRSTTMWQTAALLAASLVLGIFVGTSERVQLSTDQVAGFSLSSDADIGQLALGFDLSDMSDEDIL